ncbi:MAG: HhH-GPD-type base excision DNA repair protein [Acidimicrobiia bacterium]|nr:HhH-GPD-type base excision DNA repair protein [Acidimicrobiia bacterium]
MAPEMLPFTEEDEANRLLASNPFALMVGMLLDQQFPMERAFFSPYLLAERLDGPLEPATVAALEESEIEELFQGPPALHRFWGSMGRRTRSLAEAIVEDYDGDAAAVWRGAEDGADLYARLRELPGFGEAKARIFVGVIGKRLGEGPEGWEEEAADWPSIADVDSFDHVAVLREQKRAMKAKES